MKKLFTLLFAIIVFVSQGQTAKSLQNITISNHPTKGLQRRADMISFTWSACDSFIRTSYNVYELDLQGNRDEFSEYQVDLYASNAWVVNPATGALLMLKYEYDTMNVATRPSAMGEYSFFLIYAQGNIQLYGLLLAKMHEADLTRQRFDR
jgi:hypothetical protein